MAYIKKKDRAIIAMTEEIKKNGVQTIFDGCVAYKWDKWPICAKDVCVDNILVVQYMDAEKVIGCNINNDNTITNKRTINEFKQKYVEGMLKDMTEGYRRKR